MALNYSNKFQLKPGSWVFVPDAEARELGKDIVRWVRRRWRPPNYYYSYRKGGHVRAARVHIDSRYFVRIDIEKFYDNVTRTKISRSLKKIGFSYKDAFSIARDCVVRKPGSLTLSLPFGFIQSPIISALVMDASAIGTVLKDIKKSGVIVTVYVDDIILSHPESTDALNEAYIKLISSVALSGFKINQSKSTQVVEHISAFNIDIKYGDIRVSQDRMNLFLERLSCASSDKVISGILSYIKSVNQTQLGESTCSDGGRDSD